MWTSVNFSLEINNPAFRFQARDFIVGEQAKLTQLSVPISTAVDWNTRLTAIIKYARAAIVKVVTAQPTREYMEEFTEIEKWRSDYAAYMPLVQECQLVRDLRARPNRAVPEWKENCVRDFHKKHGFIHSQRHLLTTLKDAPSLMMLRMLARNIRFFAQMLEIEGHRLCKESTMPDIADAHAYIRAHLMVEELGEALSALAEGDVVKLFDGLCDLDYVTNGTAVAYNLPLAMGFNEVHHSNMTKAPAQDGDPRLRNKGETFIPPNLAQFL